MFEGEVAHPDRAGAAARGDLLERAPALLAHALRPVDEIQVHGVEPERLEAPVEGPQRAVVTLVGVPELGGHEELWPRDPARAHRGADVRFVPVDPRGVDVAVAELQRPLHGLPRLLAGLALEHAEP